MTLTDLIPGLRDKTPKKHRADDRIAKLEAHLAAVQADNASLLDFKLAADDYFMLLIADRNQVYDAWRQEAQRRAEAELVASCTQSELERATEALEAANAELAPHRAAEANAHRIDVPPMERDTTAVEDQATGPIDVRPLQDAAAAGLLSPVVQVSTAGASANPGQRRRNGLGVDDTQPLHTVKEVAS